MSTRPSIPRGRDAQHRPRVRSSIELVRPRSNQDGTTMVEMSIVMMLLLTLFIGILEFGLAFKDHLSVANAARDAARILSAKGNDPDADCFTVVRLAQTLQISGSIDNLDRIEIFKANADGSQNPGMTNRYRFAGPDPLECEDWNLIQHGYPSINRQVTFGATAPLDIVGVRIVYRHDWATNFLFFSGDFTIDVSNIARIEPEAFE